MPLSSLKIILHLVLQKWDKIMRSKGLHLKATEKLHLLRKVSLRRKIFSITEFKIINSNSLVMMKKWSWLVEQQSVMNKKSEMTNPISLHQIDISNQNKLGRRHPSFKIHFSLKILHLFPIHLLLFQVTFLTQQLSISSNSRILSQIL
jgi:hypothetical protein